ncbi:MAG: SCO family protein, partial [Pseudomonadota bacterium]
GGEHHSPQPQAEQASSPATPPALAPNTPGFPSLVRGEFELIDQFGQPRTAENPDGRRQLVFFGYANCQAICSVALPRMASAVDLLAARGVAVTPVLITVDPARDTPEAMRKALPERHPDLVGLTGSDQALQAAYDAFQVEKKVVYEHPELGPIYAHGSFIYVLDAEGGFETVMPPVLSPERMADIVARYASADETSAEAK